MADLVQRFTRNPILSPADLPPVDARFCLTGDTRPPMARRAARQWPAALPAPWEHHPQSEGSHPATGARLRR